MKNQKLFRSTALLNDEKKTIINYLTFILSFRSFSFYSILVNKYIKKELPLVACFLFFFCYYHCTFVGDLFFSLIVGILQKIRGLIYSFFGGYIYNGTCHKQSFVILLLLRFCRHLKLKKIYTYIHIYIQEDANVSHTENILIEKKRTKKKKCVKKILRKF